MPLRCSALDVAVALLSWFGAGCSNTADGSNPHQTSATGGSAGARGVDTGGSTGAGSGGKSAGGSGGSSGSSGAAGAAGNSPFSCDGRTICEDFENSTLGQAPGSPFNVNESKGSLVVDDMRA